MNVKSLACILHFPFFKIKVYFVAYIYRTEAHDPTSEPFSAVTEISKRFGSTTNIKGVQPNHLNTFKSAPFYEMIESVSL